MRKSLKSWQIRAGMDVLFVREIPGIYGGVAETIATIRRVNKYGVVLDLGDELEGVTLRNVPFGQLYPVKADDEGE